MKKLLFTLLLCVTGLDLIQAQNILTLNGETNDIHWVECSNIQDVHFFYDSGVNFETPGSSFKYVFELTRNEELVAEDDISTGNPILISLPAANDFDSFTPESGTYQVKFTVKLHLIGPFYVEIFHQVSNTVEITRPDDGYPACFGDEAFETESRCWDDMEIYQFVEGTSLIVFKEKGLIYKLSDLGSTGFNMYGLTDDPIGNAPGFDFYQGYQDFEQSITDIVYTSDGYLLIGFADGKILKVNGLGGSGQNMFAVNESSGGFTTVGGYHYYVGDYKFDNGITDISHILGYTLVSTSTGKTLKVNGSGGSGANLFAITEDADGFEGMSGYDYFVGTAKFNSPVTNMYHYIGQTIITFKNGKMLKVDGIGGGGLNFFAVTETSTGFEGDLYYSYYIGDAKFDGIVKDMMYQDGQLTIGFSNGKLLKVDGLGGEGQNMFAVEEIGGDFFGIDPYPYYIGHANYSSGVENILFAGGFTFITFSDGKLMKVSDIGGSGGNMYNASEVSNGFVTTSPSYTEYLVGSSNFGVTPTDIKLFKGNLVLCFANHKMFKAILYGGMGMNCFATVQRNEGFRPLLDYTQYVIGTQVFCGQRRERNKEIDAVEISEEIISTASISCYPNPTSGKTTIELKDFNGENEYQLSIVNINGQVMNQQKLTVSRTEVDLSGMSAGIYFITVYNGSDVNHVKLIKVD